MNDPILPPNPSDDQLAVCARASLAAISPVREAVIDPDVMRWLRLVGLGVCPLLLDDDRFVSLDSVEV
jgi:hypothetical protein